MVSVCVCNIFPYLSYNTALKHMEAGRTSVIAFIEPAVTSSLEVVVLGESMDFYGTSETVRILGVIVALNR